MPKFLDRYGFGCRACGAKFELSGSGDVCKVCGVSISAWDEEQKELKAKRRAESDAHIDKYMDIAAKYWYLSVPGGGFAGFVSFMYIHNQVGWDQWYWSSIAGFFGFFFVYLYTVPVLVIASIIGAIALVDKGVDFLQDQGVLEKKIEENKIEDEVENKQEETTPSKPMIEDKVEDGVENKQEESPSEPTP